MDMYFKKEGKKLSGNMKKGLVVAAALLVIGTSTSVLAAQNTDYISMFFNNKGASSLANNTTNNQVAIQSGIKMKIEDSISGGKSSIIIVSFEKADGSTFPKDAFILNLEVETKKDVSYMVEQRVTEDGKKLIAMFDVDTTISLDGEKVTVKADAIVEEKTNETIAKGPFTNKFIAQENAKNINVDLTISNQKEELALKQVYVSTIGIGIEGKRLDGNTEYLPKKNPKVKVITKDDKVIELSLSSTSTTDLGFKFQYSLDQDGDRIFLDKNNIKTIEIDNQSVMVP